MNTLLILAALSSEPALPQSRLPSVEVAVTCFFQYEQPAGMNKICYYNCLGSTAAITISSVQLCPLTING